MFVYTALSQCMTDKLSSACLHKHNTFHNTCVSMSFHFNFNLLESTDQGASLSSDGEGIHREASPHRISKQDISNPTKTAGPLFNTGSPPDSDEEDNMKGLSVSEQRKKVCMFGRETI